MDNPLDATRTITNPVLIIFEIGLKVSLLTKVLENQPSIQFFYLFIGFIFYFVNLFIPNRLFTTNLLSSNYF